MTAHARWLSRTLSVVLVGAFGIGLVVLSNWADVRERGLVGPTVVKAGNDGSIFIVSHGALWVLDREGALSSSQPLAALGITGTVPDVQPLRDGEVLIAERGPGLIHRCQLPVAVCVPFTTEAESLNLEGSFELAADSDRSHVYVAHTSRHAIYLFDGDGHRLATSDTPGQYKFPHRPQVDADGTLYVADTNHHRLLAIEREPDRFGEVVRTLDTRTSLAKVGREYPIAHRRLPDGTWWVVIADNRLQFADIVVFDGEGRPLRRLNLPDGASPTALEIVGEHVLAPDPVNLRVHTFTLAGEAAGDFGDAAFRSELARVRHLKSVYKNLRHGAWAVLLALLLALVAVRLGALPRTRRRGWLWLLTASLLALSVLSLLGLAVLWASGELYEDLIVLVIGFNAALVAAPLLVIAARLAWRQSAHTSETPPSNGG
jgi:hypothetical protein